MRIEWLSVKNMSITEPDTQGTLFGWDPIDKQSYPYGDLEGIAKFISMKECHRCEVTLHWRLRELVFVLKYASNTVLYHYESGADKPCEKHRKVDAAAVFDTHGF